MSHTGILTRVEMETMGPPVPEELSDTDVPASFLCDLALKLVAQMPEPTTSSVAAEMCMPRALVEEMLHHLTREKMIEVKGQIAVGATRYAMLERGWERLARVRELCGYVGPARTGKTAVAERINNSLSGYIWVPYAIEMDGQIIRLFDTHNHRPAPDEE